MTIWNVCLWVECVNYCVGRGAKTFSYQTTNKTPQFIKLPLLRILVFLATLTLQSSNITWLIKKLRSLLMNQEVLRRFKNMYIIYTVFKQDLIGFLI